MQQTEISRGVRDFQLRLSPRPGPHGESRSHRSRANGSLWRSWGSLGPAPSSQHTHLENSYYRFQLRGDLFFGDIFEMDRWTRTKLWHKGLQHVTLFFIIYSYNKKIKSSGPCHWLVMLQIATWRNELPLRLWPLWQKPALRFGKVGGMMNGSRIAA